MRLFRNAGASMTMLTSLVVLYVLVVLLLVVLSNQIVISGTRTEPTDIVLFASIAILFPLALLAAIGMSLFRLVQDRRAGKPGSTFKFRLAGFFTIVVALSSVPQGIISVGFLNSSLGALFSAETGSALRDGLRIALSYYDSQVQAHDTLHRERFWQQRAALFTSNPQQLWNDLSVRLPSAAALQIFTESGESLFSSGDERLFSSFSAGTGLRPGAAARASNGTERFLRSAEYVEIKPGTVLVVLASRLPAGFDVSAERLTRAVGLFEELEQLRPTFLLTVTLIYFALASPIFLLSILASFFLSDQIMRPIESLEEATRRIAEGDFTVRIFSRASDDLGLLVMSFNQMVMELDRSRRQLARTEKVAAWQEIAQRLAHEVKNPLTPIRLAAERLRRKFEQSADDFPEVLMRTTATIITEVDALTAMLNEFRSFSRLPEPTFQTASIHDVIEEVARVFAEQNEVTIDLDGVAPNLVLPIDAGQIRQVWMNLFSNAIEASSEPVHIRVHADLVKRAGGEYCRIRVDDDGPGIPVELQERIFDPYFTTKTRGTGLGLAIVERIVYDHDGQIWLESAVGSGTSIFVDLPLERR